MEKTEKIKNYYESNMVNAKYDYEVLGWESQQAQNMRFEILASETDLKGKSILDVGCGLGNLLEYLISKGIKVDYHGVDILEPMIERAKKKKLEGEFYCVDLFKDNPFANNSFDVVYASGIFNLNLGNNREFLKSALDTFFKLSRKYIVFNLLHHNSPGREDKYFYFDPREVKDLLEQNYSVSDIKIVEEYLNNDFTVICSKK